MYAYAQQSSSDTSATTTTARLQLHRLRLPDFQCPDCQKCFWSPDLLLTHKARCTLGQKSVLPHFKCTKYSKEQDLPPAAKVMRNPLILEKVAKRIPSKTLLNLRRTCTAWNSGNFLPELKKNRDLVGLCVIDTNPKASADQLSSIQRLSQVMRSTNWVDRIFTRFKFDRPDDNDEIEDEDQDELKSNRGHTPGLGRPGQIVTFMLEFGNTITNLDLGWAAPNVLTVPELWTIVFEMTPNLVELKLRPGHLEQGAHEPGPGAVASGTGKDGRDVVLKLKCLDTANEAWNHEDGTSPAFTALVTTIIHSAPNLESLSLDDGAFSEYIRSCLTALQNLADIQKLTTLRINALDNFPLGILLQMAQRKTNPLRLQEFSGTFIVQADMDLNPHEEFVELSQLLYEFLETQDGTIQKLILGMQADGISLRSWPPDEQVPSFRIPKLEHLTNFKMDAFDLHPIKLRYDDGGEETEDEGHPFPKLRTFSYRGDLDEDNLLDISYTNITTLDLCGGRRSTLLQDRLGSLPLLFPAVTRLEVDTTSGWRQDISAEQVGKLWTLWPALTHLTAHVAFPAHVKVTPDEFLSGVPAADFEDLQHDLDALPSPWTVGALCILLCRYKTRPGLMNLRQLKELKLDFTFTGPKDPDTSFPSAGGQLTDIGGYFGLSVANSGLQLLEIKGCSTDSISVDCLAFIRTCFPVYTAIEL